MGKKTDYEAELKKGYAKAEAMIKDPAKTADFLNKVEDKLKDIPQVGETLARIPIMIEMVRDYIKGVYKEVPVKSIVAIIAALIYFLSPVDLIPDFIPGVGLLDDAAVIAACLGMVNSDIDTYQKWRERQA